MIILSLNNKLMFILMAFTLFPFMSKAQATAIIFVQLFGSEAII